MVGEKDSTFMYANLTRIISTDKDAFADSLIKI